MEAAPLLVASGPNMSMRLIAAALVLSALAIGCGRGDESQPATEPGAVERWPTGLTPGPGTSPLAPRQSRTNRPPSPSADDTAAPAVTPPSETRPG